MIVLIQEATFKAISSKQSLLFLAASLLIGTRKHAIVFFYILWGRFYLMGAIITEEGTDNLKTSRTFRTAARGYID